jgi:hypothetical protein
LKDGEREARERVEGLSLAQDFVHGDKHLRLKGSNVNLHLLLYTISLSSSLSSHPTYYPPTNIIDLI